MSWKRWAVGSLAGAALLAPLAAPARAQAPAAPAAAAQPPAAAEVNGEAIPMADLEAMLRLDGRVPVEMPEAKRRQMRLEALSLLIDDVLMQQFLAKNGPRVDPAEVQKQRADLEQALARQGKKLADYLRESGQTEQQLQTNIVNMLRWRDYVKGRITEVDVKRYYDDNRDFFDNVRVKASHIVIRVSPNASDAEVQQAVNKLLALRKEIVEGRLDFAEAARKHSECPSHEHGGDIGYFPRKWVVEEPFAQAAFSMKVGEVSNVVKTSYGVHLIKVTDRKVGGEPSDYNKIKEQVRELCVEEMRQNLLTDLRKRANIKVNVP
ncbi:MAG TPA: peptidylprolyl isomerase [Gemmataceae bacterium]|nr:peptidylprolyl isomerase [Gemmataceae bacterium]